MHAARRRRKEIAPAARRFRRAGPTSAPGLLVAGLAAAGEGEPSSVLLWRADPAGP
jgi:hypothetical protein